MFKTSTTFDYSLHLRSVKTPSTIPWYPKLLNWNNTSKDLPTYPIVYKKPKNTKTTTIKTYNAHAKIIAENPNIYN